MRLFDWLRWLRREPGSLVDTPEINERLRTVQRAKAANERASAARDEAADTLALTVSTTRLVTQGVVRAQRARVHR